MITALLLRAAAHDAHAAHLRALAHLAQLPERASEEAQATARRVVEVRRRELDAAIKRVKAGE